MLVLQLTYKKRGDILIGKILDQEQELEKQLSVLRAKGFDVSEDSNITRLLSSISETMTSDKEEVNQIISKLTFDGRSGELLDNLYGFFGIPRLIKSVNGACLKILNNGNHNITFLPNTIFEYKGKNYRVTTTQYIDRKTVKNIYCYPTTSKLIDTYVNVGEFKILLKNIDIENVSESEKESYILKNTLISNIELTLDKETDLEYQSRANGLIQHFGDSSVTKIKNYIMGIENVSDVKIIREHNRIKIIVIPEQLRYLEKILGQVKESIDYFSSSPIILEKPTITVLSVTGLTNQLLEWFENDSEFSRSEVLDGITKYLTQYAKDITISNKNSVSSDSIEFIINKYFIDNNIVFSLNEKLLKIKYSIYSDEDYVEPIITNELTSRQTKEIKTDLLIIGDVL